MSTSCAAPTSPQSGVIGVAELIDVCVGGCGLLVGFGLFAWAIWAMLDRRAQRRDRAEMAAAVEQLIAVARADYLNRRMGEAS